MTLEVVHRHEKLAPESSIEFMAPICGAGFCGVFQGPYVTPAKEVDLLPRFVLSSVLRQS